ncbi:MAG: glycyl-radical enzyme activating protein, partial [Peptococcaceae bacterium]|nr:glycyl-radical enzyme activating protein [Peptococcaceae bacterium]
EADIIALAETVAQLAPKNRIHILPYHNYGKNKYPMLGRTYALEDVKRSTMEQLERVKAIITSHHVDCKILPL